MADSTQSDRLSKWVNAIHDYHAWLVAVGLVGAPGGRDGLLQSMLDRIATSLPILTDSIADVLRYDGDAVDAVTGSREVLEQIINSQSFKAPLPSGAWETWLDCLHEDITQIVRSEFVFHDFDLNTVEAAHGALTDFFTFWMEAQKALWEWRLSDINGRPPKAEESIAIHRIELAIQSRGIFLGTIGAHVRTKRNLARSGGLARSARNEKSLAMMQIEARFMAMQRGETPFLKDADFARQMLRAYPVLAADGAIKNNCTKWRKKFLESSS